MVMGRKQQILAEKYIPAQLNKYNPSLPKIAETGSKVATYRNHSAIKFQPQQLPQQLVGSWVIYDAKPLKLHDSRSAATPNQMTTSQPSTEGGMGVEAKMEKKGLAPLSPPPPLSPESSL
jgi:hypothetical protein